MVRRKKTTIFLDAKESSTVMDLKKMIEGITKKSPADQQLFNKDDQGLNFESIFYYVLSIHLRSHHAPFPKSWKISVLLGLTVLFKLKENINDKNLM